MPSTYKGKLDALSMFISSLCMVHCVVLPLLVTTLPVMGIEVLENSWLELASLLLASLVGGLAVVKGYLKYHRKQLVIWLFVSGMMAMAWANALNEEQEAVIKIVGVLLIGMAHLFNYRLAKKCTVCKR